MFKKFVLLQDALLRDVTGVDTYREIIPPIEGLLQNAIDSDHGV